MSTPTKRVETAQRQGHLSGGTIIDAAVEMTHAQSMMIPRRRALPYAFTGPDEAGPVNAYPAKALAHHWPGPIRSGAVRDQPDLARLVGVSRSRGTQVMCLLWLAPDTQEAILLGTAEPTESGLRLIAAEPAWVHPRQACSSRRWR
jgi:hypothetical protein